MFSCDMKLGVPGTTFREVPETATWKLQTRRARASSGDLRDWLTLGHRPWPGSCLEGPQSVPEEWTLPNSVC